MKPPVQRKDRPKRIDTRTGFRGTTTRTVRISDDIWDAAVIATAENGTTVSDVVRDALRAYNAAHPVAS